MNLTIAYPIAYLLITGALAAVATYWVYSDTVPELSLGRRSLLGSLRFFTLFILLLLLSEPLISRITLQTEEPVLAVLVDESESMTLVNSDSSGAGEGTLLDGLLDRVAQSIGSERIRVFGFGSGTREAGSLDSIRFKEPRTDLSTGLDHIQSSLENEPLGAVLLISDGRHNGGRNPEHLADLFPVPILSVVVGDTTIRNDIRIQQVLKNDISYVGREVPIRVRIRNEGFELSQVRVDLSVGSKSLDRENVMLPVSGSEVEVELSFVPDSVGLFQYRIDLTRLRGELTLRNNTEIFALQVLERERQILLLAGAPSPDVSFIRQHLDENPDTDLVVRTLKGTPDGAYYEGTLEESLEEIDLIILVGYPSSGASPGDIDRVVARVEQGTPILFIMDRSADLATIQRRLATVLPARPTVIRPGYAEGGFDPTERASVHAIFDVGDRRNSQRWGLLPPLALSQARWEATPGSVTLATTRIRGISIDDPILVLSRSGNQRSATFLASGYWKWGNVPDDLEEDAVRWRELFSNLILWLVTDEDDRLVRVAPVESLLDEGDAVVFGGQVYNENLQPISDVSVSLDITHPTGEVFPYVLRSLGNGQYRADIGSFPHGTYYYEANATREARSLGTDQGSFTVGALSVEFRNPYADTRLMQQVAQRSGGIGISTERIEDIPSILASFPTYTPATQTVESQTRLWRYLPMLFVMLLLMSMEWFFRKRFGLV